jgi:WD40 repeat protein
MFRWLAVLILLAGGTVALMAVLLPPIDTRKSSENNKSSSPTAKPETNPDGRNPVQPPSASPSAPSAAPEWDARPLGPPRKIDKPSLEQPISLPSTLAPFSQQEVPAEKEGKVLVIGTEVKPGEVVPQEDQLPDQWFGFLIVEAEPGYNGPLVPVIDKRTGKVNSNLRYRLWKERDAIEPGKVIAAGQWRKVRALREGMQVKAGDLVALVNPAVAFAEMQVSVNELGSAHAEYLAAVKARETTWVHHMDYVRANNEHPGSISKEEFNKAKLEYEKAAEDEKKGLANIGVAQNKLNKAATTLKMYEIRADISGRIKTINKNVQGEAVKPLDPLLLIQDTKRLRVEGMLDLQEALKLREGMKVFIDASRPEPPRAVLSGHRGPITCVAVTGGKDPVVVSGSEDLTLRGWDPVSRRQLWQLDLHSVPRALACSGDLVLFGDDAGVVRLLDLKKIEDDPRPPVEMNRRHEGAVLSVAFSPNGQLCASGGTDLELRVWDVGTHEQVQHVQAHRDQVTAVQFAGPNHNWVVTAGRDHKMELWDITDGKTPRRLLEDRPKERSGDVTFPGVSPDGKLVLFDQGHELVLVSLDPLHKEGVLANPTDAQPFTGMALFSPDGKTILTNTAAAGRLQLWRAPIDEQRPAELRQFIWTSGGTTCAAFAPPRQAAAAGEKAVTKSSPLDESAEQIRRRFAVTGTTDHQVLVWGLPSKEEVDTQLFKLTERSFAALRADGVPEAMLAKLAWFELTDKVLDGLRAAEVPDAVLSKLAALKDKRFAPREKFVTELARVLDRDELSRFQDRAVQQAQTGLPNKKFETRQDYVDELRRLLGMDENAWEKCPEAPLLVYHGIEARLSLVEPTLETSSRRVRIRAELDNPEWLTLTDKSLAALLAAGMPEGVLRKLGVLKDRRFSTRQAFVKELGRVLDKDELARCRDLVLQHADNAGLLIAGAPATIVVPPPPPPLKR